MSSLHKSAALTDIGHVREENQDAFFLDDGLGLYIVADGLGGMRDGAAAAHYVIDDLPGMLQAGLESLAEPDAEKAAAAIRESIVALSNGACERLGAGSGATVVLAWLRGEGAFIAHLGDSRAYLLRQGSLEALTEDHNVARLLVEMGRITREQARTHPSRHQVVGCVGMADDPAPEVKVVTLEPGDRLLLCSDGLTGMVPEEEIEAVLGGEKDCGKAAEALVAKANEAGGYDNVTVVVVDVAPGRDF